MIGEASAKRHFDVAVIGGGLAGVTAAVTAAERGEHVLLIERAPFLGGSAAMSLGFVWTLGSLERLQIEDPGEYQLHGRMVIDGLNDALEWLNQHDAALSGLRIGTVGRGPGQQFDMPLLFSKFATRLTLLGGEILLGSETKSIIRNDGGYGLEIAREGNEFNIAASSVIFATGGRQGDPKVRRSLVGGAYTPVLRGNHYSDGGGARLARQANGALNLLNTGFYGHLFPAGIQPTCPMDFVTLAMYHSVDGLLVSHDGTLIPDRMSYDHSNVIDLARYGRKALLLWSEEAQARAVAMSLVPGAATANRWAVARDRGGRVAKAQNQSDLASRVAEWGYTLDLLLGSQHARILGDGLIYAVEVEAAVTFTFGGIVIDGDCRVLDDLERPIRGLYAAGADISDAYHRGYGGGLSLALVSGRLAGAHAADLNN